MAGRAINILTHTDQQRPTMRSPKLFFTPDRPRKSRIDDGLEKMAAWDVDRTWNAFVGTASDSQLLFQDKLPLSKSQLVYRKLTVCSTKWRRLPIEHCGTKRNDFSLEKKVRR